MNIFNPRQWKKEEVGQLNEDTVLKLDNRYINVGENVFEQQIDNLGVLNVNIGTNGKIYFNGDNTTQTTAFQPSFVTNQINQFASNNNTFTGEQKFQNLKIIDSLNNETKIYQIVNNLYIENTENTGGIFFYTYTNGGQTRLTYTMDQFGNFTCQNDLVSNRLRTGSILIGGVFNILSENNFWTFANLRSGSHIFFKTKLDNGNDGWSMAYSPSGSLYGINNVICNNVETLNYRFRRISDNVLTNSLIYLSSANDLIFDNRVAFGTNTRMRFINYQSNGTAGELILDQFGNLSGVNDLNIKNRLIFANNSITHQYVNSNYIIDNRNNGSSIKIRNYDNGAVMREITIDPILNMSGINNLYCNSLFVNNVLRNFNDYDSVVNKTTIMSYNGFPHPQVNFATSLGQVSIAPYISVNGAYNTITKEKDAVIYFNNNSASALSIVPWIGVPTGGVRITENNSELYKPKVMDSLEFSDGSQQETAMTDDYINNLITNRLNEIILIPSGVIMSYGGRYLDNNLNIINPPNGYLWCFGGLVSQATYPNLFTAIGHLYSYGRTIPSGMFYLPDLRGATLKGTQINPYFTTQTATLQPGEYQQNNVGYHRHQYTDRGVTERNFSGAGTTQGIRPSNGTYFSQAETYDPITNNILDQDTRVNSVAVNYIIKF